MTEGLPKDIEVLQEQIVALEEQTGDPVQLKEALLAAMASLISVLDSLEAGRLDGEQEAARVDQILAQSFRKVLKALERSQRELRESEERYKAIVESQTNLLCRFLPDGSFTFVNDYLARSLSQPREKLVQQRFQSYFVEKTRLEIETRVRLLTLENPLFSFEHAYKTPDGRPHWHQWTCRGIFDPQGNLSEVQAVGHDISVIKQAELTTAQHNRELSALHTATTALLSTLDTEKLLSQILDAAIVAIPVAKKGTLHLIAPDTGQLELRASIGYSDPRIQKFVYGESSGYVARGVRERRPLIVHDAHSDIPVPRTEIIPETNSIQSAIVAPLVMDDRILGALSLESTHRAAFTDADLRLLVSFAATATNAIRNAELHAQVQKLAITDALTGLFNRRGFFELGEREVERSFRFKRPLTAIMVDVDNFKRVNDVFGHAVGDQVLRGLAGLLSRQLRKIDILGRYGGDEFIILLPETHIRVGARVAERLRVTAEEFFVPTEKEIVRATISVGVTGLSMEMTNLEALINQADAAMYAAKDAGRNCVVSM